ncbi:tetratricopeptide repeat protein [Zhouia sp. PK063]|uniref:tetratricopeptide repeat-containing sensor histidine kinase n=1 Tax=Zhouia sp. PK063 TaxID=3373602 RepID=UPI00378842CB
MQFRLLFLGFAMFVQNTLLLNAQEQVEINDSISFYLDRAAVAVYDSAPESYAAIKNAERLVGKDTNSVSYGKVLLNKAIYYYIVGDYNLSLRNYLTAKIIFEKFNDDIDIAKCYLGQGLIQQSIGRNKLAITFFKQSLQQNKKIKDLSVDASSYIDLGVAEIELQDYKNAEKHLIKAIPLATKAGKSHLVFMAYNKLGTLNYLKGDMVKAISYFKKVITKGDLQTSTWEQAYANTGLCLCNTNLNKLDAAEDFGMEGLKYATILKAKWDLQQAYQALSKCFEKKHDTVQAFKYYKLAGAYKDSLYDESRIKQVNVLQLDQSENENKKLLEENKIMTQKLDSNRFFIIFIIIIVVFLIIAVIQFNKIIKQKAFLNLELEQTNKKLEDNKKIIDRQNASLEAANQTKNRLFSILSHDLRSPINAMSQVLELISEGEFSDDEKDDLLEELRVQIAATSVMLNDVLEWARGQFNGGEINKKPIEITNRVENIINSFTLLAKRKDVTIIHNYPSHSLPLVLADKNHADIIVYNLISNAIKYTDINRDIIISYIVDTDCIGVSILNHGKVIDQDKIDDILNSEAQVSSELGTAMEKGTGLGLLIVKQFLDENDCKMEILQHPGLGTEFIVNFSIAD